VDHGKKSMSSLLHIPTPALGDHTKRNQSPTVGYILGRFALPAAQLIPALINRVLLLGALVEPKKNRAA